MEPPRRFPDPTRIRAIAGHRFRSRATLPTIIEPFPRLFPPRPMPISGESWQITAALFWRRIDPSDGPIRYLHPLLWAIDVDHIGISAGNRAQLARIRTTPDSMRQRWIVKSQSKRCHRRLCSGLRSQINLQGSAFHFLHRLRIDVVPRRRNQRRCLQDFNLPIVGKVVSGWWSFSGVIESQSLG